MQSTGYEDDSTEDGSVSSQGSFFNLCLDGKEQDETERAKQLYIVEKCRFFMEQNLRGSTPSNRSTSSCVKYLSSLETGEMPNEGSKSPPYATLATVNPQLIPVKDTGNSSPQNQNGDSPPGPYKKLSQNGVQPVSRRLSLSHLDINFEDSCKKERRLSSLQTCRELPSEQPSVPSQTRQKRKSSSRDHDSKLGDVVTHQGRRYRKCSLKTTPMKPKPKKTASIDVTGEPINLLSRVPGIQHEFSPHPPTFNVISPSPTLSSSTGSNKLNEIDELLMQNGWLSVQKPVDALSVNSSSSGTLSPASMADARSGSQSSVSSDGSGILPPLRRTPKLRRKNLLPPLILPKRQTSASSKSSQESLGSGSPVGSPIRKESLEYSFSPTSDPFLHSSGDGDLPAFPRHPRARRAAVVSLTTHDQEVKKWSGRRRKRCDGSEGQSPSGNSHRRRAMKPKPKNKSDYSSSESEHESDGQSSTRSSHASSLEVSPRTPDLFEQTSPLMLHSLPDSHKFRSVKSFLPDIMTLDSTPSTPDVFDLGTRVTSGGVRVTKPSWLTQGQEHDFEGKSLSHSPKESLKPVQRKHSKSHASGQDDVKFMRANSCAPLQKIHSTSPSHNSKKYGKSLDTAMKELKIGNQLMEDQRRAKNSK